MTSDAIRLTPASVEEARKAGADLVKTTPIMSSRSLSEDVGGTVALKAENLQRTGSFKLRGALSKIATLPPACEGVITGSAGNHAQSLAYAAKARGLRCQVLMPETAPLSKVAAVEAAGADLEVRGSSVDACIAEAKERAGIESLVFVHPFDDPGIIRGQATLGLELLEAVADLAAVIVPIGGGGLAGGVASLVKSHRPEVEVIGVQAEAFPSIKLALNGSSLDPNVNPTTLADGIAIKRPGGRTVPLLERSVDGFVLVPEDEIAQAMVYLLERAKLVTEGAGAVGVAGLLSGRIQPARSGTTVVVLSGGNVDSGVLGRICRWHETTAGRRMRLFARVGDRPGSLGALLTTIGQAGANIIDVEHVRDAVDRHVDETGVEITMETRGRAHAQKVRRELDRAGFSAELEPAPKTKADE